MYSACSIYTLTTFSGEFVGRKKNSKLSIMKNLKRLQHGKWSEMRECTDTNDLFKQFIKKEKKKWKNKQRTCLTINVPARAEQCKIKMWTLQSTYFFVDTKLPVFFFPDKKKRKKKGELWLTCKLAANIIKEQKKTIKHCINDSGHYEQNLQTYLHWSLKTETYRPSSPALSHP